MRCSREYFETLREEALKKKAELEIKRFDTAMRIEGWKVEIFDAVLEYCFNGLYLEDVGIAIVEATLKKKELFLYECGRKTVTEVCTSVQLIPGCEGTPCVQ